MIVSRFPYPLEKGDKLRAYYQLKELSKYFDITLVALSDQNISQNQRNQVSRYCDQLVICKLNWISKSIYLIRAFITKKPFQTGYFYSSKANSKIKSLIKVNAYKHIYCQLIRTSEYVKNVHAIPKTLDYMDALSAGIKRRVNKQVFLKKWIFRSEAKRLERYEQHIFDFFENKTIISEQDKNLIHHPDKNKIVCIPNGIDASFFEQIKTTKDFDFVFVGNMSYPPNIEAAHYIADNILPAFPGTKLLISGSSPNASVKSLAHKNSNITLTGWVEDIRKSYAQGQIFVAPMMIGTGMQNKLLEAMAMKTPCVTTPLANNAIHAKHGQEIMVGTTKEEIIACIEKLRENQELSNAIAIAGSDFVRNNYSWEKSVTQLKNLMNA